MPVGTALSIAAEEVGEETPAARVGAGTGDALQRADTQQLVSRRRGSLLPAPSSMPAPTTISNLPVPGHRRTAIRDSQLQPDSLSLLREQENSKRCATQFSGMWAYYGPI